MHHKLLGKWKSESPHFKNIIFNKSNYEWGKDKGRWAIQGDEIWLITDSKHGTKWFFKFEGNDILIFVDPEDFIYLGGGEYIYYQMTPPKARVAFKRIKKIE